MLEIQNFDTKEGINEEIDAKYIDNYTLIRHKIISKTYFIKSKNEEETFKLEEYDLPKLPPLKLNKENSSAETEYDTELETLLRENKSVLLDINWVEQIREAYIVSLDPIKVYINFYLYLILIYTQINIS